MPKTTPSQCDREEWRPVAEWEGVYDVSSYGRVRNAETGYILTPQMARKYYYVHLNHAGRKRRARPVHRLVAIAFIPGDTALVVNHKDLNRLNNNVSNLEWVTPQDNTRHALSHGHGDSRGSRNRMATLTEDAARVIANSTVPLRTLSYAFGTTWATCSRIRNGKTWAHATKRGRSLTTELMEARNGKVEVSIS